VADTSPAALCISYVCTNLHSKWTADSEKKTRFELYTGITPSPKKRNKMSVAVCRRSYVRLRADLRGSRRPNTAERFCCVCGAIYVCYGVRVTPYLRRGGA